jgi:hypothetical protein
MHRRGYRKSSSGEGSRKTTSGEGVKRDLFGTSTSPFRSRPGASIRQLETASTASLSPSPADPSSTEPLFYPVIPPSDSPPDDDQGTDLEVSQLNSSGIITDCHFCHSQHVRYQCPVLGNLSPTQQQEIFARRSRLVQSSSRPSSRQSSGRPTPPHQAHQANRSHTALVHSLSDGYDSANESITSQDMLDFQMGR